MLPQSSLLDGLQVLIVDSNPDSASLLALIFEQDGVEILVAASANEAIDILQQNKPDLLISELRLPGEDGYSLIRKVKAIELERKIQLPAIALTTSTSDRDRDDALAAGFCKYLSKPFNIDELIESANNVFRQSQSLNQGDYHYFYLAG